MPTARIQTTWVQGWSMRREIDPENLQLNAERGGSTRNWRLEGKPATGSRTPSSLFLSYKSSNFDNCQKFYYDFNNWTGRRCLRYQQNGGLSPCFLQFLFFYLEVKKACLFTPLGLNPLSFSRLRPLMRHLFFTAVRIERGLNE
jgi:hypothetical protein